MSKLFFRALEAVVSGQVSLSSLVSPGFSLTSKQMLDAIAAHCGPIETIIDAGGNVGQFAVAAARRYPRAKIHSFEPLPGVARTLRTNVARFSNVRVHELALGRTAEVIPFYSAAYSPVSSALRVELSNTEARYSTPHSAIQVRQSTIDAQFATELITRPALLKLDVQGYEAEVLAGASNSLRVIDWLVMEMSFVPLYENQPLFHELDQLAATLGFTLVAPVGIQYGDANRIIETDGLYRRM